MFGHAVNIKQINKQTKKRTMFSNGKMPIAHQISICFHVDGFFSLSLLFIVVVTVRFTVLFTNTARETFIVYNLTVLLFVVHDTAGTLVFFIHHLRRRRRRCHSFFFSNNSISHLTNALTLNKQQYRKNMYAFSFIWFI